MCSSSPHWGMAFTQRFGTRPLDLLAQKLSLFAPRLESNRM